MNDPQTVELEPDGSFEVQSVPAGLVSLSVFVPGYIASNRNASLVPSRLSLLGRVDHDLSLRVLLDRGSLPTRITFDPAQKAVTEALRQKPLAGAEGPRE